MENRYKALYDFFRTMGDTAVDICWGNNPVLSTEEMESLTTKDFNDAFNDACAEMAIDSENADWYLELFASLADYYGNHLKIAYARKQVILEVDTNSQEGVKHVARLKRQGRIIRDIRRKR